MEYPTTQSIAPAFECFFRRGVKYVNTALSCGMKMHLTDFFARPLRPHNTTGYYHRSGSARAGARLFPPEGTPIPPIEPGGEYDPFRKDDNK